MNGKKCKQKTGIRKSPPPPASGFLFPGNRRNPEAILSNKNFQEIKRIDYEASQLPHGYLIESAPPYDRLPLIRVELSACNLLLGLYTLNNEDEKLIQLSDKIANEFSFDGWYWFINKKLGNIYAQHNQTIKAYEQYQLSIEGIKKRCKNLGERYEVLYEEGFVIKPEDFISWEDQSLKIYYQDIAEIERLQENVITEVSGKEAAHAETTCFFSGNGLKVERTNDLPYHLTVTTLTGQVLHTGEYNERYLHLTGLGIKPQALYLVTVNNSKMRKTFKLFNR